MANARRHLGFTLLELMIVAAIVGIVVSQMFASLGMNAKAYSNLDQVVESQQGMRAIADLLERDIRHAGFMVPEGAAVCGVDNDGSPDILYVTDASAIDPQDDIAIYEGAELTSSPTNVSSGTSYALDSLIIETSPPNRPAYDTDGNGTADSDFRVDGGVIIMDANEPDRGAACGRITAVSLVGNSITFVLASDPLGTSSGTPSLVAVPAHEYRIGPTNTLLRDNMILAGGVEDLQVAYFLDADGDWRVDAGEMRGDGAGADFSAKDTEIADVREIRFNLIMRTRLEDPDFGGAVQSTENRNAAGNDGFHRRRYTGTVMLRNMGSRLTL
jgi:prepilin-type N-terminal cleavage/methylation domain-containing protein